MRWVSVLLLLVATALERAPASAAAGSCPDGFHLHAVGDGDHEAGRRD